MKRRLVNRLLAVAAFAILLTGCGSGTVEEQKNADLSSENVIITETGEVLEIEGPQVVAATEKPQQIGDRSETDGAKATATPLAVTPEIQLTEPEQEQVITQEDQIEPAGNELQMVFLGDSIFDNNRDGTGIPYLTSVQCEADVYNLAIGGTSATIETGEQMSTEEWTSRSLAGVVYAMTEKIPTDIFEGTRTKEILDNPNVDFSKTDYFIIEYGMNDFFRGVPRDGYEHPYDVRCYVGALRFAIVNLRALAPDATIVLCAPNYAQFYDGNWMIGDGNSVNTGYGTLFDYKGSCEAVANEMNTLFLDAYGSLGIDSYTAEQYLEDGVHLTAEGRQLYADALARVINGYEETKNN